MAADALSDILSAFDTSLLISGSVTGGGPWALQFPPPNAIKFGAVVRGACWQIVGHAQAPVRLESGDVFVVNGRDPLLLASDLAADPVDSVALAAAGDSTLRVGKGDDFYLLGGHVMLDPVGMALLRDVLPPMLHLRAASTQSGILTWLLDHLVSEATGVRAGSSAVTRQLAHLLFLYALRDHVETGDVPPGWLKLAGDVRLAPALQLMHGDPARNWRLPELARASGMSRSSFSDRFKSVSGMAPLAYLTFWRMRLAEQALRSGSASLASLAASLGYGSESAFSTAFKRLVGTAPAHFRANLAA